MTALIGPDDIPYLPRGVRLQGDRVRGIRVLQAPERAMQLDQIGEAILSELDGARSLDRIVRDLAARYDAPVDQIGGDVRDFLTGLIERRMVFVRDSA
ncbi:MULTISPECIES: pyrroloquinoline quinone biosynthesis peptide chaperone PqqD [Paracoccus]|jgi:pyrroloquinoline quinone biosynthesis protein D|uniref:Pyrroloquinoline quinone biosynthesis peptide chaperone PqqD n=2 Tax=Paracoccus TaxID=265 RepID=A0A5C4R3Z8_9RHOB|nr:MULTISPECIES: pyrroloquinoline quinone biosynthesis peptide chaperone PqqD [Paracoccus]AZY92654.1 pyrroloquinoline quinone biosynthesis peptide chaperone PqqD [Paracoccus sp. Arc7-R13]KIX17529.1 pyrroloquinoline quinone biosynthesis protein PqqD [Paracoccus sp. 228]MBF5079153.1 pyrroloquinoline quinone biosynthesis peptide chaperone PqqD [Paracoccus sp. NBH48]QXI65309.1 Coenzyme PQQ synthesis protein D [Paracoccus marcusii]TNC01317.1 pyrroloquinoline quinone biosynthesis peptide chaperone P|tara:strand:+ start:4396 stop:4689 length:294 start_codon:yes stop_codon:yes gene_type:complete